jgi:hypothetical protein
LLHISISGPRPQSGLAFQAYGLQKISRKKILTAEGELLLHISDISNANARSKHIFIMEDDAGAESKKFQKVESAKVNITN